VIKLSPTLSGFSRNHLWEVVMDKETTQDKEIEWEFEPTEDAKHRLNLIFKLLLSNDLQ